MKAYAVTEGGGNPLRFLPFAGNHNDIYNGTHSVFVVINIEKIR